MTEIYLRARHSIISCASCPWRCHSCFETAIVSVSATTLYAKIFFSEPNTLRMAHAVIITMTSKLIQKEVYPSLATEPAIVIVIVNINSVHRKIEISFGTIRLFNTDELVQMTINRITRTVSVESLINKTDSLA